MESAELPLIVRKSKWPIVVTLVFAVAAAAFLFWLPDIYSHPLQFGLAYGLCAIASACVLFLVERKPDLVISEEGIRASVWGDALVYWEEIDHAFIVGRRDGDFLCLTLLRAEDFLQRSGAIARMAATANRAARLGDLMIRPSSLRLDAKELLKLIQLLVSLSKSTLKPRPSAVRYRMD